MPYAFALVVALTAIGLLLRWWGPINPAVDMTTTVGAAPTPPGGATSGAQFIGSDGPTPIGITLANRSHSSVDVQSLQLRPLAGSTLEDLRLTDVVGAPATIAPGGEVQLTALMTNHRVCVGGAEDQAQVMVTATLRTSSGRTKIVSGHRQISVLCGTTTG